MSTTDILTTARALLANCTGEGKLAWWQSEHDGGICCGPDGPEAMEVGYTDMNEGDSALVLAAPTLVRQLVAECERLTNAEHFHAGNAGLFRRTAIDLEQRLEKAEHERDRYRPVYEAVRDASPDSTLSSVKITAPDGGRHYLLYYVNTVDDPRKDQP